MNRLSQLRAGVSALLFISILAAPISLIGQTKVVAPKNPFSVAKDVQLGQQAAAEVERQMPLLNDSEVQSYVERVGRRLSEAIPAEFQHPEFRYSYKVVDARDINAFALPGGFTYVNRGLIEAAHNEGEMAGAIAHEISHVALRHGTAQAAKAQKYQAGAAVVGILGAILGAPAAGQLGQMGIGAYYLKFSREYEKQADLLGAHIMANAGYDPHDLANMFRTLEQQGGGGPQWLSDHPNPGNRFEYINREADALRVNNPIRNTNGFTRAQAVLRDMPRARSMEEISRSRERYPQQRDGRYPDQGDQRYPDQGDRRYPQQPQQGGRRQQVEHPSSRFRNYNGNSFRISVPDNWRELPSNDSVTFAPDGAYREVQGQFVFTHGVQVGAIRAQSNSLKAATDELIRELTQGNPNLRRNGGYERETLGRRDALGVSLTNISELTGRPELVTIYTAMRSSGDLFYLIAVAPQDESVDYQRTFMAVLGTVSIYD